MAGGNPRAGNPREAPEAHRPRQPQGWTWPGSRPLGVHPLGGEHENTAGAHRQRALLLAAFCLHSNTAAFGDCLIMARYKHQVTFCKVVTTGEGYNYYNEASPAPDSLPSNQSQTPLLESFSLPATWSPSLYPLLRTKVTEGDWGKISSVTFFHQRVLFSLFLLPANEHLFSGAALGEGKS